MTPHPDISRFLDQSTIPQFIGGEWVASASGKDLDVFNPSTGSVLASVAAGNAADVDDAVKCAHDAFPKWSALSPNERAVLLQRFADALEKHAEELAQLESLDVGKAISAARGFDVPFGIECVRYYADFSTHAIYRTPLALKNIEAASVRQPYGVCGFIFPWNFPFTLFMWGVIPALAAGNTAVVKPSEVTPLTSLYLCHCAQEAGLPPGVINVVVGIGTEVGKDLTEHPLVRRMSFTGSPGVGRRIAETCGRRLIPCKLELGGKGAAVIFEDVDLDQTAAGLAGAITLNTGQVCCTATRWIVQDKIHDAFTAKVAECLRNIKVGPGTDEATEMGALVSQQQLDRVLDYFEKGKAGGASVVMECERLAVKNHEQGYYVSPHLLAGDPDNICFREEVFGPTAYITKFGDEAEALDLVNSLTYGLANSVWTSDLNRAARVAERMVAGNSWINAHNVFGYGLPYGGVNLSGIGGGVNSPETFYDYLRPLTIARPL